MERECIGYRKRRRRRRRRGGLRNPLMGKKLGHLLQRAGVFFLTHEELQGCFWWFGARKLSLVYLDELDAARLAPGRNESLPLFVLFCLFVFVFCLSVH